MWWFKCIPCRVAFNTPQRLVDHAVSAHGANRVSVTRAVGASWGGRSALVETEGGRVMVMTQPQLL